MSITTISRRRILWCLSVGGLLIYFTWVLYCMYQYDMSGHGYILGDWLTNFQDGGFKRRGLGGSFLFMLQDLTGVSLQMLVFFVQSLAYLVFLYFLLNLLKPQFVDAPLFLFIWSPVALLMFWNDPNVLGRKEVLLFALLPLYNHFLARGRVTPVVTAAFCLTLCVFTLLHEGLVFYLPYFMLLRRLHQRDRRLFAVEDFAFAASMAIPLAAIVLWSGEVENGSSIDILRARGVELHRNNVFTYNHGKSDSDRLASSFFHTEIHYIWAYLYGMWLLYLSVPVALKRALMSGFLACFVFSLPFFFIAIDWGRYIMIHFILSLVVLLSMLSSNPSLMPEERPLTRWQTALFAFLLMCNVSLRMRHFSKGFSLHKDRLRPVRDMILGPKNPAPKGPAPR